MSLLLRLNEHYTSVQGEGPHVGELTQFVRFSGCNMRCPGWPCDTPHAIFPDQWRNDPKVMPQDLFNQIGEERARTGAKRVCLTGGEPTLQDRDSLRALMLFLTDAGFDLDMFSNGSMHVYPEHMMTNPVLTIIMDWKLQGSGEADTGLEIRNNNLRRLRPHDAVKFVVASDADLAEAWGLWMSWDHIRCKIYVGAAWGKISDEQIVEFMTVQRLPWILNVQVHKHIWGDVRGV